MREQRNEDEQPTSGIVTDARRDRDAGITLVEIVITVAIMAIVIAPLLTAVMTTIRFSAQRDQAATLESVLNSAADRINRAPRSCDYGVYVNAAVSEYGWSPSQASIVQSRYAPGASPTVAGSWVAGPCAGSTPDQLVQLVRITVRSPSSGALRTIEVVKSNV